MGWQHIDLLFRAKLDISHIAMMVLFVLAKAADEAGECYPSMAYIAEKAKLSRRSVIRGINELIGAGLITTISGKSNYNTNNYRLLVGNFQLVDNFDPSVTDSHISSDGESHGEEGQLCQGVTSVVTDSHISSDGESHGRIQEKKRSKLVSKCPSAEGSFVKPVNKSPSKVAIAPAIKESGEPFYKVYGRKPETKEEVKICWELVFNMGATKVEADEFCRYNQIRNWSAVTETCTVKILAHSWIKSYKRRDPSGYMEEQRRREELRRFQK